MLSDNNSKGKRMTPRQRRRSMFYAKIGAIHAVIGLVCLGGGVLTLAALKLGAGEVYLGLLNFVIFGALAFRFLTMSAVEKQGKRKVMFLWVLL